MSNQISILTLVHHRTQALHNQLSAIAGSTAYPAELIVVHMNEDIPVLPPQPFPVRQLRLGSDSGLNLAAARNYAMEHALTEKNVFLDVDCLPASTLIAEYDAALEGENCLVGGRVRYLSQHATENLDRLKNLFEHSQPDPIRPDDKDFTHELFWTLNFGCTKRTFARIGGFDTAFAGYGGEDTDFAFQARKLHIAIRTIDATAFHQHHASYSPPLNHLEDILRNAHVFYKKWGIWPMEGWLSAFEEHGYIRRSQHDVTLLRTPTDREIEAALKK
ncbi:galactosyltransferase-related protein [Sphingobacterium oryzagri]|uniref:Galactosyltransferase-related protein n=1 Tax=Sphingobacterium oryzagri TaxID=3025669 RepID=A0ABY7WHG3_9SPHI|nr:galactosyltransferase-related protein [Sphingobacterium sp. KACC 22765]WDF66839.1 galactosyltransferase-related protein [Sphingobacterium sp. KACC 22765]